MSRAGNSAAATEISVKAELPELHLPSETTSGGETVWLTD